MGAYADTIEGISLSGTFFFLNSHENCLSGKEYLVLENSIYFLVLNVGRRVHFSLSLSCTLSPLPCLCLYFYIMLLHYIQAFYSQCILEGKSFTPLVGKFPNLKLLNTERPASLPC